MNHIKTVKIILAALLILSLFNISYQFHEIIRFICLYGFSFLAYHAFKKDNKNETFIYITLALICQPIFSIYTLIYNLFHTVVYYFYLFCLQQEMADTTLSANIYDYIVHIIDIIISICLIVSIFKSRNK